MNTFSSNEREFMLTISAATARNKIPNMIVFKITEVKELSNLLAKVLLKFKVTLLRLSHYTID